MRRFCEISIAVALLLSIAACDSWNGYRADDEVVARVGTDYLYRSALVASIPSGLTAADSVSYSQAFVDRWIIDQLKQQEAEKLFSQSGADIDRMVEQYRRSLLVRRLEQQILASEPSATISQKDIVAYYNAHKGDFRLAVPMVKGEIVAFPDSYRRQESLLKLFGSSKSEQHDDFEQICLKNNFQYHNFAEWVSVSDFLSYLPLTRNAQHDKIVASRKLQQIHHDKVYYYFRITALLEKGDTMPLQMVEENIRQILINRHRAHVVHQHEEMLLKNALSSGHAKKN